MNKTTIYLPEDLQQQIEALAKQEKRSKADLIREALRSYVEKKPRRLPKSLGIVTEDVGMMSEDIDAWLKENWIKDLERDHT